MKVCGKCRAEKPTSEFHKSKDRRDGLQPRCNPCGLEMTRQYRARNYAKVRQQENEYRAANRERMRAIHRKWRQANPEKVYSNKQRYSDRLLNLPYDGWTREEVFKRDDHACTYCGDKEGPLHVDHIVPVSRGGINTRDNLTTSCVSCNLSKGSKLLHEWKP